MRSILMTTSILLSSVTLWPFIACAGEQSGSIHVVAAGVGETPDSALKNAFRNAVVEAMGTMIDSSTLVENDEIMDDTILSHSNGYIEEYTVIGEPKKNGALIQVKIEAQVKSGQLRTTLESKKISLTATVDGKNASAKMGTQSERDKTAADMGSAILPEMLAGFPMNYLNVELIGEPRIDAEKKKLLVKAEIALDRAGVQALIKRMSDVLENMSLTPVKTIRAGMEVRTNQNIIGFRTGGKPFHAKEYNVVVCTSVNDARDLTVWKCYSIPDQSLTAFDELRKNTPTMIIDLVDDLDDIVMSKEFAVPVPYIAGSPNAIFPLLRYVQGSYDWLEPGSFKSEFSYEFTVSADEAARIRRAILTVETPE